MAQTDPGRILSLSLSSQKAGQKQKGQILAVSAQLMALVSALGSLSSVALSSARVLISLPPLSPFPSARGHFYFALTEEDLFINQIDFLLTYLACHFHIQKNIIKVFLMSIDK